MSVTWTYPSNEEKIDKKHGTANTLAMGVVAFFMGLVALGTFVEVLPFCDKPDYSKDKLALANKFRTSEQYEVVSLGRKSTCAQWCMMFSAMRGSNSMNLSPLRYKGGRELNFMNGAQSLAAIVALWGSTIFLQWFSILADPVDFHDHIHSFSFTLTIGSSLYAIPILFFVSGFLQTHSLYAKPAHERFTCAHICSFYVNRIFRYVPILGATVMWATCLVAVLGAGPFWTYYPQIMSPCKQYWWTVPLLLNNIIPYGGSFE